ncbi:hypothetical protein BC567DRAFT_216978 [Phyllosticta citribraziliensis]
MPQASMHACPAIWPSKQHAPTNRSILFTFALSMPVSAASEVSAPDVACSWFSSAEAPAAATPAAVVVNAAAAVVN